MVLATSLFASGEPANAHFDPYASGVRETVSINDPRRHDLPPSSISATLSVQRSGTGFDRRPGDGEKEAPPSDESPSLDCDSSRANPTTSQPVIPAAGDKYQPETDFESGRLTRTANAAGEASFGYAADGQVARKTSSVRGSEGARRRVSNR